jgi:hypothetical protein
MRPAELQDPLNRWLYHPLAWQLARLLARTPLTPNVVSVIGGLFVVAAAWVYAQPWYPLAPLLGMALHMTWHVVDGADGDLARLTGRSSPIGEMVDGICDYASHVVLYLVLGTILQHQMGAWGWAWAIAAGLSHVVQSNHVEVQRRQYQWWVHGTPWLRNSRAQDPDKGGGGIGGRKGLGALADLYLRLATGLTPFAVQVDHAVEAAQDDPARLAAIRTEIRREATPLLLLLKFLGPNPRAIVLGLSMLLGGPLWYFIYQTVVLNALLVVSVILHNRSARRTARRIAGEGSGA